MNGSPCGMNVLTTLRKNEATLRARGIRHAALFGSVAREDAGPESDVDILIEFDPDARVTIYDYAAVKDYIGTLFKARVDVVDREALKPHLREASVRHAIYAF
jgi:uncharacterized protein